MKDTAAFCVEEDWLSVYYSAPFDSGKSRAVPCGESLLFDVHVFIGRADVDSDSEKAVGCRSDVETVVCFAAFGKLEIHKSIKKK